jgi:hypothetical protein
MSSISLVDLGELGKVLGAAADAIAKLGDSIAHLISLGVRGWDDVSARSTRKRLISISAKLTVMGGRGNMGVIESLRTYIRAYEGRESLEGYTQQQLWNELLSKLGAALPEVESLFTQLARDRSDLVTQDIYRDLIDALNARTMILEGLSRSVAPTSIAEIDALREAAEKYDALHRKLYLTIDSLHRYIGDSFGRLPYP